LKPKKRPAKRGGKKVEKIAIVWDEERVGQLSIAFLEKVFTNMGADKDATVCFGTTGKGIRPGYLIEFTDKDTTAFSGSGHRPLKNPPIAGKQKVSQPFPHKLIGSILKGSKK
jgi:hypothetical protein